MFKLFFDSNVIIDALTERENSKYSLHLMQEVVLGNIHGFLSSKQVTDIYYVLRKYEFSDEERVDFLKLICKYFTILPTLSSDILISLSKYKKGDFEDLLIDEIAKVNCVDYLVTNNINDFKSSSNVVVTPKEINNILKII